MSEGRGQLRRTPWFPASTYPARPGWYEVQAWGFSKFLDNMTRKEVKRTFRFWTGTTWKWNPSPQAVLAQASVDRLDKWRGLTQPAK